MRLDFIKISYFPAGLKLLGSTGLTWQLWILCLQLFQDSKNRCLFLNGKHSALHVDIIIQCQSAEWHNIILFVKSHLLSCTDLLDAICSPWTTLPVLISTVTINDCYKANIFRGHPARWRSSHKNNYLGYEQGVLRSLLHNICTSNVQQWDIRKVSHTSGHSYSELWETDLFEISLCLCSWSLSHSYSLLELWEKSNKLPYLEN